MSTSNQNPGDIIRKKIVDAGYKTIEAFCLEFTKTTNVTLSDVQLGRYLKGKRPTIERFDGLTSFLNFTPKEKQNLEGMYIGTMRKYKADVQHSAHTISTKKKARRKSTRTPLLSKENRPSKKPAKKAVTKSAKEKKVRLFTKFEELKGTFKSIHGKMPSKRQMVLLFELAIG